MRLRHCLAGNACLLFDRKNACSPDRKMSVMEVTFSKLSGRRYMMTVVRERGPELAPRQGPGYHDYLPHDAVHFLVEAEAGLSGGVFGQIASGRNNIFTTADPALRRHQARREAKQQSRGTSRADLARSESLASLCLPLWELRTGHRREAPDRCSPIARDLYDSPVVARILARLDEFAARWHALPVGGGITLTWPPIRPGSARSEGRRQRTGTATAAHHGRPIRVDRAKGAGRAS
jgi:hypothetical protein